MDYVQVQRWLETRDPICSVCPTPTYRFDQAGMDVKPIRPAPPPAPSSGRRTFILGSDRRAIQYLLVTCESCGQLWSFDLAVITQATEPQG
jgi:hypothetical protein